MSEGERRIADAPGRFLKIVEEGIEVGGLRWTSGRILLSNRRLILVGKGGKRTLPLASIGSIKGMGEVSGAVAGVTSFTTLRLGEDVLLLSAKDHGTFELELCSALLESEQVLIRHPAVEGGVVRETEWETARVTLGGDETVNVATNEGSFVSIDLDDVGNVEIAERTVVEDTRRVVEDTRRVVEVEHADGETSVQTHLAGTARCCSTLLAVFNRGQERNSSEVELDDGQKQVLMALYSGVSAFEIPEFTGAGVDSVESEYEHLIELGVLSEVRTRREVELTSLGRNLASEAINDE